MYSRNPRPWTVQLCGFFLLGSAGMASADDTAPADNQLEAVVVTAQYHRENLQNTPIAITAITAQGLEERNLSNITDIGSFVPSAVIQPLGAGFGATVAAYIRGVGLGDNTLSFEPGVPIYIDDVYIGRPQGAMFDLLDLEQVEVLRGPQGTLFGKNAEGGTIRMMSVKPKGDDSVSFTLTYGNYNRIEARGVADVALIDGLLNARFSFSSKRADGYFTLYDYVCQNGPGSLGTMKSSVQLNSSCVSGHLGDENTQAGRAAFRFTFSDAVEFNLVTDITTQSEEGPADKYTVISPTLAGGLNGFYSTLPAAVAGAASIAQYGVVTAGPAAYIGKPPAYDQRFITNNFYTAYSSYGNDLATGRQIPNENDLRHRGVAGTLEWKLWGNMNLKSVTAYRELDNEYGRDSDGSPFDINATYDAVTHRQFTQEVTVTGLNLNDKFNWATGMFYYRARDVDDGLDVLYPGIIHEQQSDIHQTTENWAAFAHGGFEFTDAVSLSGGVRYTSDRKNATVTVTNLDTVVGNFSQWIPLKTSHVDYDISLNYKWDQNLMTYLKYSTGFKGGGYSPRPANALQTSPFKPEFVKTAELGGKLQLFDNRVRLNTDVYYSRYLDQQTFSDQLDSSGVNWFREVNAGTARIWGLESELQAELPQGLRVDASFGYLNYLLLTNGGNALLFAGHDCGGDTCESQRTPKYTAALGIQKGFEFAAGKLTPRLDATYQSTIYFASNNGCFAPTGTDGCGTGAQTGYAMLNGRLTWAAESRKWDVSLWARNLTNKEYFNGKLSLISFFGREQGNPGPPREYGVTFKRNFKMN
jgi:iron complex outermembrane receptor protein